MNLYVWHNVLSDYTDGIAFALAPDVETARRLVKASVNYSGRDYEFDREPDVHSTAVGFHVYGGG
jgi:hypothetical protein